MGDLARAHALLNEATQTLSAARYHIANGGDALHELAISRELIHAAYHEVNHTEAKVWYSRLHRRDDERVDAVARQA